MVQFGILDFGQRPDMNSMENLHELLNLAVECDRLGFSRFWLGEHHYPNVRMPWSDPAMLLPVIGGLTDRMRIGTAGTLVGVHAPYQVATNFKMINNLFDDRIDLGLAKGVPDNRTVCELLTNIIKEEEFDYTSLFMQNVKQLYELFYEEERNYDTNKLVLPPYGGKPPETWFLSRSARGLDEALSYRCHYSRSLFHQNGDHSFEKDKMLAYQAAFLDKYGQPAGANVAIACYCAETHAKAVDDFNAQLDKYKEINKKETQFNCFVGSIDELITHAEETAYAYGVNELILYLMPEEKQRRSWTVNELSRKYEMIMP